METYYYGHQSILTGRHSRYSRIAHWPLTLKYDPDFQSLVIYGHDPYTCKKIQDEGQLFQRIEWKRMDGQMTALPLLLTQSVNMSQTATISEEKRYVHVITSDRQISNQIFNSNLKSFKYRGNGFKSHSQISNPHLYSSNPKSFKVKSRIKSQISLKNKYVNRFWIESEDSERYLTQYILGLITYDILGVAKKYLLLQKIFWQYFPSNRGFLTKILHAYCVFISMRNYKILFKYLYVKIHQMIALNMAQLCES